jgi:hypothetical protein
MHDVVMMKVFHTRQHRSTDERLDNQHFAFAIDTLWRKAYNSPNDIDSVCLRKLSLSQYPLEQFATHSQFESEVIFRTRFKPVVEFNLFHLHDER